MGAETPRRTRVRDDTRREIRDGGVWRSLAAASAAAALSFLSISNYKSDQRLRDRSRAFLARFHVGERRPLEAASIDLAPSGDWAAAIAADAAVSDANPNVSLSSLTPRLRALWLEAAAETSEELAAARDLMAAAVAARPGWGIYRFLLGELEYLRMNRTQDVALASQPDKWREPLRLAAVAAPGDDAIWTFLAGADLETWQVVLPAARPDAEAVLRRAFLDPRFVARALPSALALLDRAHVLSLLPDEAAPLRSAFAIESEAGDVDAAARLSERMERAERRARGSDLKKLEERQRLGDREGALAQCEEWVAKHDVRGFDDAAGRGEIARLLAAWPTDRPGTWGEDPRTAIVLFLLDRTAPGASAAVDQAVTALSKVPPPIAARAKLAAGDARGAEEVFRDSQNAASPEWTPYFLELAKWHLHRREFELARETIQRVAPDFQAGCDAEIVRREIARAAGRAAPGSGTEPGFASPSAVRFEPAETTIARSAWTSGDSLSLCLDPERTRGKALVVKFRSSGGARPAAAPPPGGSAPSSIVAYGWDGIRSATSVVPGETVVTFPLLETSGRHSFFFRVLAGLPVEPVATEIR